jgi:hypothetical protein
MVGVSLHPLLASVLALLLACSGQVPGSGEVEVVADPGTASKEACADRAPLRQAFFGDLHVHTSYSMDAYIFDTRPCLTTPIALLGASRFLSRPSTRKGAPPTPCSSPARPLDFAAVTDHAESFGATSLCTVPGTDTFDSLSCRTYRGNSDPTPMSPGDVMKRMISSNSDEVCGEDALRCRSRQTDVWQEMIDVAEKHYDRSAARTFPSFVA